MHNTDRNKVTFQRFKNTTVIDLRKHQTTRSVLCVVRWVHNTPHYEQRQYTAQGLNPFG
jgi:hypothetical protein